MPCGRSAHLEAGYFVGAGKPLYIVIYDPCEPELMYKMATQICLSERELIAALACVDFVHSFRRAAIAASTEEKQ
jgi:hypothetical protein